MAKRKTNNEFIEELKITNPKYIPLEKYKNNTAKILCKCTVHNLEFYSTPKLLTQGRLCCPICCSENRKTRTLKTNDEFLTQLKDNNIDVLPLEEYRGGKVKILFKCSCGDDWITTPDRVLLGNHCKKCGYSNFMGDKNHFYNPELTDEDRINSIHRYRNPNYKMFVSNCFERDNYSCRISGKKSSGDIVVHHLNGFNWDETNRTNTINGVTLCEEIHKKFHSIYGKGNNTKEQFLEFIDKLSKENGISKDNYNSLLNQINMIK